MFLVRTILVVSLTAVVTVFSVLNRAVVPIFWNPVDAEMTFDLPIYAIALACTAIGFIVGGVLVWLNMGGVRKERRQQKRDIKMLEKEVTRLKDDVLLKTGQQDGEALPVLLHG